LRRCGGESHDAFSRQLPQQLGADVCSESRIDRRRKCAVEAHQSERLVISPTLLHSEIFTVHVLDVVDFFVHFHVLGVFFLFCSFIMKNSSHPAFYRILVI